MQNPASLDQMKKCAAEAAVEELRDGMIVGLGSGSTATLAVRMIAERVQRGLRITGIPTSEEIARLARSQGIPVSTLEEHTQVDITIDGADEVELGTLNLIKGHGGALLREKIVASASKRLVIIVDETKLVDRLARRSSIPIEVVPFGWPLVARELNQLSPGAILRRGPGNQAYITDGGHYVLDARFIDIPSIPGLAGQLDSMVGIVEHGLFLWLTSEVIVGEPEGVRRLYPDR